MGDDFGTELEYAAFFRVFFDDLYALTGGNQFPNRQDWLPDNTLRAK